MYCVNFPPKKALTINLTRPKLHNLGKKCLQFVFCVRQITYIRLSFYLKSALPFIKCCITNDLNVITCAVLLTMLEM